MALTIDNLHHVDWLAKCGEPLPSYTLSAIPVLSWNDVKRTGFNLDWENIRLEAGGDLTGYLTVHYPNDYQGVWNKTVKSLKPAMESILEPKLRAAQALHAFEDRVIHQVKWDILYALMTSHYLKRRPPVFYLHLFEVYHSGHLPCGWFGKWPEGGLRVF